MIRITCPDCGFEGSLVEFDCSYADEIFCPKCRWAGMLEWSTDEDDDDEGGGR